MNSGNILLRSIPLTIIGILFYPMLHKKSNSEIVFDNIIRFTMHSDKNSNTLQRKETVVHNSIVNYDSLKRPFQVVFKNLTENKQDGLTYNSCYIEIAGTDKIQLPGEIWQDKVAWSNDSRNLILVKLYLYDKMPAFSFVMIDTDSGKVKEGINMLGIILNVSITGQTVHYRKRYYLKHKSVEKPCCETEEDYTFQ